MSLMKSIVLLIAFVFISHNFQKEKPCSIITNYKSKYLSHVQIGKDSLGTSIGIYIDGYESEDKRNDAIREREVKMSKKSTDYIRLSQFSINFIGLSKPTKLQNLNNQKYIPIEMFSKNHMNYKKPCYIIFELDDGTFLKWEITEFNSTQE